MARKTTRFVCRDCGGVHAKWMGRCPDCGAWDALEEHREVADARADKPRGLAGDSAAATAVAATPLTDIKLPQRTRIATGIGELDRVLGGQSSGDDTDPASLGLVPGSTILVGGDPGIGKSTLLLQAAAHLAKQGHRSLYVTSEESVQQTQLRARRLGLDADELYILTETNLARIIEQIRRVEPVVTVVDSVQVIYKGDEEAAPGSVSQLRTCCTELSYLAKSSGIAVALVGHVTKQGQLAGPRLLEHLVDTVLYFEGDRYHSHRVIRAVKNRFGTTLEVGLFEMSDAGLREVVDGSGLLAAEYRPMAGSVVCPVRQGSRCLLVEIQALTATGFLGSAKRKTSGLDGNRLAMLIAVLEKRGGLRLADQDIFASSVGGMKIVEPAADLAVATAIAGAFLDRKLEAGTCAVGEIGLGGEVRHVQQLEQRVREAARLGFTRVIVPESKMSPPRGCELIAVREIGEVMQHLN